MKKVLITGSNGFVGQNLISSLSNKFDLYGLDRHQTRNLPKSNYYIGDLGDLNLLKKVFEEIKPDVLIHLAAIVHKNNADTSEKIIIYLICSVASNCLIYVKNIEHMLFFQVQ